MNLGSFFPPSSHLGALPNWHQPRLVFPAASFRDRWCYSAFYPAYRLPAKVFRLLLRVVAALGFSGKDSADGDDWELGAFVTDCLPKPTSIATLVGTNGPTQKVIVQLWLGDEVIGYVKYAEKPAALKRLRKECELLSSLPPGLAPSILKAGPLLDGYAVLMTAFLGRAVRSKVLPQEKILRYVHRLIGSQPLELDSHPWVNNMLDTHGGDFEVFLDPLQNRQWPVAIHHGDFAPWNILHSPQGKVTAIDWEYGEMEGFPYLDLAFYILQTAALVKRWSPGRGGDAATKWLANDEALGLSKREATALVRLAAFRAYREALEDGHDPEAPLQRWRHEVFGGKA